MTLILLLSLAASEIALAILCGKAKADKKLWRKNRLIFRAAQTVLALLLVLLPVGQNWRFVPLLAVLLLLLLIAGLKWLAVCKKDVTGSKTGARIGSCVLSILLFALLLVPAFLFTGYKGLPVTGNHKVDMTSAILIDKTRTDPFEQDGSFREVPVHFYYPTDAAAGEQFPLVVFSHGAFGYYESNTSTYMELASNGYVVAALDHPHHAFFTQDTAGQTVVVDTGFFQTATGLGNPYEDPETYYPVFRDWMALRTADVNAVLDLLEAAGTAGATDENWFVQPKEQDAVLRVLAMTDFTKIGLMGHSMGGATAVQVGRERDDISAVIDLDGTMLGEYLGAEDGSFVVNEEPYPIPVLEFANWEAYNDLETYRTLGYPYPNIELISHAPDAHFTTVRDTLHMDFTDLPLLSPTLGDMFGSGTRDTAEVLGLVNPLVREFFDCYLKGEGAFSVQDIY